MILRLLRADYTDEQLRAIVGSGERIARSCERLERNLGSIRCEANEEAESIWLGEPREAKRKRYARQGAAARELAQAASAALAL
jgi:hypothetical protein